MARLNGSFCRALLALGMMAAFVSPVSSQRPTRPQVLAMLEPGLWELRDLDNRGIRHRSICLGDRNLLLQLQHRNSPCSRLVVAQDQRSVTVHYTCPANGYGQTLLKVETPRLAQVDTQGIVGNGPFSYRVQARRVGGCPASAGRRGR